MAAWSHCPAQRGAMRSETIERNGKVQGVAGARSRSARAIAKNVGLGPEPVTDRTSFYLWVLGVRRDFLVFPVPTEIPERAEALYALTER